MLDIKIELKIKYVPITQKSPFEPKTSLWEIWLLLFSSEPKQGEITCKHVLYITRVKNETRTKSPCSSSFPAALPNHSLPPLQPKSNPDSSGDTPSLAGLCEELAEGRGLWPLHPAQSNKPFWVYLEWVLGGITAPVVSSGKGKKGRGGQYLPGACSSEKWGGGQDRHQPHKPRCESMAWKHLFFLSCFLFLTHICVFANKTLRGERLCTGTSSNHWGSLLFPVHIT